MKFKPPTLTPGKRATLERTKKWMQTFASDLDAKKAQLDELHVALEEAESRKAQSEKDAALNPDAALKLAAADAQLSRLAPQIRQLQQSLERETAIAIRQVNGVRSSEVRDLLFGPLVEQVQQGIATAIRPFFQADWAMQFARQIMERSEQYRQIMFYLNRPPVVAVEVEDAKREIDALAGQLTDILTGETLIEVSI